MKKIAKAINSARTWLAVRLAAFSISHICPAIYREELIRIIHKALSDILAQSEPRGVIQSKRGNK